MMRRHPSPVDLATWFDGEGVDSVGWHVASCGRCRRKVDRFELVRSAVRGDPLPILPAPRMPLVPVAAGLAVVLVAAVAIIGQSITTQRVAGAPSVFAHRAESPHAQVHRDTHVQIRTGAPRTTVPVTTRTPGKHAAPRVVAPEPLQPTQTQSSMPRSPSVPAITLGVLIPTTGPLAPEGRAVLTAVRTVADDANTTGGIHGAPIRIVAVPAEHPDRAPSMGVRFLVGGFGADAPQGVSWLVPADADMHGSSVLAGELDPAEAGAELGQDLVDRKIDGPVGIVVGDGPDARFANGLASVVDVQRVAAHGESSCSRQVLDLRLAGVSALAVAGPPELQAKCASALSEQAWWPRGGILLPPSSAYAHLERLPFSDGARTVLGFPWPTDSDSGAAWFRQEVPRSTSYRSLVSFAAAELAVKILRSQPRGSSTDAAAGSWISPLFRFEHGANVGARVVVAFQGGWFENQSSSGDERSGASPLPGGDQILHP
jgi:ABC-type branched-subunit amino acid transport system substrate-binding protein